MRVTKNALVMQEDFVKNIAFVIKAYVKLLFKVALAKKINVQ
jgi:hypothetical protein